MSQSKIAVYSLSDLKNTTDDALPTYLTTLPAGAFTQSHFETDVRLALGYAAVAIGAGTFYLDWTRGWDATKTLTLYAVLAYFALNGAFTYWIWAVERGVVFRGARATGEEIEVSTRTDKHSPVYHVTARWRGKGGEWTERRARAEFTRWFTREGVFVAKPFQQWLASEIPAVGSGDPNNVVEEIGRGSGVEAASGVDLAGLSAGQLDQVLGGMVGKGKAKAKRRG